MSEANQKLARQWVEEVWNNGNEAFMRNGMHRDADIHIETRLRFRGPDGLYPHFKALRGAFPDFHLQIEAMMSQDDAVTFRWHATGTHRGADLGFPATNRQVRFEGITWVRFSNGQIVEGWDRWNAGALLAELQAA